MKKNNFNMSLILVLVVSLTLGGCQAVQDCFEKKEKSSASGGECSSCGTGSCTVHDRSAKEAQSDSTVMNFPIQTQINSNAEIACKLTDHELQKHKETIVHNLREKIKDKKELDNGYAFQFTGDDEMLDEITEFIKLERKCCNFFTFNLSVNGSQNTVWLEITGDNGTKEFIISELNL